MLKVGLIGLGGIGRHHLRCYGQIPEAQIVAVADVRAAELQADESLQALLPVGSVQWFDDYRSLLASGLVDAVDIGLPTFVHREAAVAALEAGIPVLCEKPMALTLEDCDAMIAASQQSGKLLMIAQCIRFWPEYQFIYDLVQSGEAGRLVSLQMWRGGPTPGLGQHWMADPTLSGGAVLDLHIHDIDWCHYLLGLPEQVFAQGGMSVDWGRGYDYILTNLDYGNGMQISAASHWADVQMPFIARCEARFEDAFVRLDSSQSPMLAIWRRGMPEAEHPLCPGPDAYVGEIRYFLEHVRSGEPAERCPARGARDSVALVKAAVASIERRGPVAMDQFLR